MRVDAFELWCWRRLLRVPWTAKRSNQSILRRSVLGVHSKDWCWSWNSNTLTIWCEELTHLKRPWCWEKLRVEGEHIQTANLGQMQHQFSSVQLLSPVQLFATPWTAALLELTQAHVHWVGDAIQPSHPLSSPSPPTFNLSQHQGLFQWVSSSHQVAKVLEFQLQHQSFQWIFRTDFL